jgi:iron complex transport system permease protein
MLMLFAFVFGLLALFLVYLVALLLKQESNLILVLAGVVLNGFFNALVSLIQYLADSETKLPSIVFWLMGSFATTTWTKLVMFLVPLAIAGFLLLRLRWRINVLSLGDRDAKSLGMRVNAVKWLVLIMCAVIVSSQVAVSGSIGWIGLVIPHLARIITGVDHRKLLPAALLLGGCFMIIVDDLARMLSSSEIPLGILTAIFGAPLFILLLVKSVRGKG